MGVTKKEINTELSIKRLNKEKDCRRKAINQAQSGKRVSEFNAHARNW